MLHGLGRVLPWEFFFFFPSRFSLSSRVGRHTSSDCWTVGCGVFAGLLGMCVVCMREREGGFALKGERIGANGAWELGRMVGWFVGRATSLSLFLSLLHAREGKRINAMKDDILIFFSLFVCLFSLTRE